MTYFKINYEFKVDLFEFRNLRPWFSTNKIALDIVSGLRVLISSVPVSILGTPKSLVIFSPETRTAKQCIDSFGVMLCY